MPTDSLQKYSYLIYGLYNVRPVDNSARKRPFPDTLMVRLFSKNSGDTAYFPIIIKGINDTITGRNWYEEPDVFAVEFKAPQYYRINSIESFFDTRTLNTIDTIASYGFPFHLPVNHRSKRI